MKKKESRRSILNFLFETKGQPSNDLDVMEYGPYKMTRRVDDQWRNAAFYVKDRGVPLSPQQTEIMAFLIALQGKPMLFPTIRDIFRSDKSRDDVAALETIKIQICHIRNAIKKETGDETLADIIGPAGSIKKYNRQVFFERKIPGAYQLRLQS